MLFRKLIHHTIAPGVVLFCAGAIAHLQFARVTATAALRQQDKTPAEYQHEQSQIKTNLALLNQLPPTGFDPLIADLTFLNFVQYFGDDRARAKTGYPLNSEFFQVIVDRDPQFLGIYNYLSASVTLFEGQPQRTVDLLNQGLQAMPAQMQPEAYYLWQAKGTDELLFLGQPQAARQSYEQAAAWASQSDNPEIRKIALRSQQTAQFLASNPDSRQARVSAWANILVGAIDPQTRQFASQQIEALGGQISVTDDGLLNVQLPSSESGSGLSR
jgi:hypothetical protein